MTNLLIHETSPYLLQHAHNPVHWMPWGEAALQRATSEDKPLLISIGYSACHWCHVMERESFEDAEIAQLMNTHFVCIKVDREERPDVDSVYMEAVQLMTGGGGWPLNCFAMPDGSPFFGGTYFRKPEWAKVLIQIAWLWQNDRTKVEVYAAKLSAGMVQLSERPMVQVPDTWDDEVLETAVARWQKSFDYKEGGTGHAPKFPMPNNYLFLLAWAWAEGDSALLDYVHLTLCKMARGGIYDHIGGGFSRYSTDALWKVPHFEKMLYDNAQLLSLYSQAYLQSGEDEYLRVINATARWIQREMTAASGLFFSAVDADSEGVEGRFYVWDKAEVEDIAGQDFALISDYFNLNEKGRWEHDQYILLRDQSDAEVSTRYVMSVIALRDKVESFCQRAFSAREKRPRPALDDKSLTSWNALAAKGLLDAYAATGNEEWLNMAQKNLAFLITSQMQADGRLWHNHKNGKSTIHGFLEDYAMLTDALLRHYELTFDDNSLTLAQRLLNYVFQNFDTDASGLFLFTSKRVPVLVAKKAEVHDNVIPASNSVLATCCYKLGLLMSDQNLLEKSRTMLAQMEQGIARYPSGYSQWMVLHMMHSQPFFEVAIVGKDCLQKLREITRHYIPNAVICGSATDSDLPILQHRFVEGKTLIYVCRNGACQLPVETVDEALAQLTVA